MWLIHEYISNCHCIVLPSYREGLSKVLLEGMSVGRPIITTNVPGCKQLVQKNGFTVEPKSINSLLASIIKFINLDNESKLIMGEKSRSIVEQNYNVEIITETYLQKINEKLK